MHVYVCMFVCMYVCIHKYTLLLWPLYVHPSIHPSIHPCIHAYIHTYIQITQIIQNIHMCIHVYIDTCYGICVNKHMVHTHRGCRYCRRLHHKHAIKKPTQRTRIYSTAFITPWARCPSQSSPLYNHTVNTPYTKHTLFGGIRTRNGTRYWSCICMEGALMILVYTSMKLLLGRNSEYRCVCTTPRRMCRHTYSRVCALLECLQVCMCTLRMFTGVYVLLRMFTDVYVHPESFCVHSESEDAYTSSDNTWVCNDICASG